MAAGGQAYCSNGARLSRAGQTASDSASAVGSEGGRSCPDSHRSGGSDSLEEGDENNLALDEGGDQETLAGDCDGQEPKRIKVVHARVLSENEKVQRRREGNRKAAQRLRARRIETLTRLEEEVSRLEHERNVYMTHMYTLAASCRAVSDENRILRTQLEALGHAPAAGHGAGSLAVPPPPVPLTGSLAAQLGLSGVQAAAHCMPPIGAPTLVKPAPKHFSQSGGHMDAIQANLGQGLVQPSQQPSHSSFLDAAALLRAHTT